MHPKEVMKINVELVKYDTEKTKKRKRANILVEARTEQAVIDKLELIHKGDKVKIIHEIKWSDAAPVETEELEFYTGVVKYFDAKKGFGFIKADKDMDDLFFHVTALSGQDVSDNDPVEFEIGKGPKGLIAIHIHLLD